MAEASERIERYFKTVNDEVLKCYDIANTVKAKGFDPDSKVMIPLAKNMAERVEGLIASVAPQVLGTGVAARIQELEVEYGMQNWRVALVIADEMAKEKFCKFDSKEQAMEVGIRTGFCYVTVGVVSSPLEGFIGIKLRDRMDGQGQYMALVYGGPIRSAGGTGASVSVLIADYVRKKMGLKTYDATEKEIKRAHGELCDYNDRVTNLQYFPSEEEVEFLLKNLPVQLDGDPSEKYDVSNYKDLARRNSNRISNGFCLITAECLSLKAPKVWKQLNKWGKEMGMEQWMFMEEFVKLQKEVKARGAKVGATKGDEVKIKPDTSYIRDLVGGRPVFTHPMRNGGFRLRYGRGRVSGFSADSIHPATMVISDDFLAVGTQMKTERPGKATTVQVCDEIDGPIVKLKNGDVLYIDDVDEAKRVNKDVEEIIYLGDILINYGDFLDRAHKLIPPGFVEEWWVHYFRKAVSGKPGYEKFKDVLSKPLKHSVSFEDAKELSETLGIPIHPKYIFYWNSITKEEFVKLYNVLKGSSYDGKKMVICDFSVKRSLELVGCPHKCVGDEYYVIEDARPLVYNLGGLKKEVFGETPLEMVNSVCESLVRDKLGYFIGARMGRPEKAKMRKMQGSPHGLFPIGEEGGRLRCFQSALEAGKVKAEFPVFDCSCGNRTIYGICEKCGLRTVRKYYCYGCKDWIDKEACEEHGRIRYYSPREIDVKHYFYKALEVLGNRQYPPLIKGVRSLMSVEKVPEHLVKGILRARHNIHVNKDGTVRYDMSELPVTHFKPCEVGTSVTRLRELGYTKDVYGEELVSDNQVIELIAQDMILPACPEAPEEGADQILFRVTKFIDDCLEHLYKMPRYYNLEKKSDLVGQLIVAMSPHTSAGIVSRIIGFSQVQGMYAHPLLHSIMRRDCLHYDTFLPLKDSDGWKVVKIGDYVENLNSVEVVDDFGTQSVKVDGIMVEGETALANVKDFTKHKKSKILRLKLECGREIKCTLNHKFYSKEGLKVAKDLKLDDKLVIPYRLDVPEKCIDYFNLIDFFEVDCLVVRNLGDLVLNKVWEFGGRKKFREYFCLTKNELDNYLLRDSYCLNFIKKFIIEFGLVLPKDALLSIKRDSVSLPVQVEVDEDLLWLIGFYVAEGYSRRGLRCNQVDFSVSEKCLREKVFRIVKDKFGLNPTYETSDRYVYSSRLFYEFFCVLGCGENAYSKRVPSMFLDLDKEKLKYFLQGYFDGDGSVSLSDCRVCCDSVSEGLLKDLEFVFKRYNIFVKFYTYTKKPGNKVRDFYLRKGKEVPEFTITKLVITSSFYENFFRKIGFGMQRKQNILSSLVENCKPYGMKIEFDNNNVYSKIVGIEEVGESLSYCLEVDNHKILPNGILTGQCDGDEAGAMLLLDCLLNFSRKFLPNTRGVTQDAPLVLTSRLVPSEVDDMVFNMDVVSEYPIEFYDACMEYKNPWDVKIEIVEHNLGTEKQYEGMMFTHDTRNVNEGVRVSAYKTLPSMKDKVLGQMEIGRKIRAVDENDVARLVIERHFVPDIKGNLRKFSQQSFRCVKCNEIYRRPPLAGKCDCSGKLVFTIAEGSICKYMDPALNLAEKYNLPAYLQQSLKLLKCRIESVFGKEKEKQEGLGKWF
jgi:DNA polymerase II large subunit